MIERLLGYLERVYGDVGLWPTLAAVAVVVLMALGVVWVLGGELPAWVGW